MSELLVEYKPFKNNTKASSGAYLRWKHQWRKQIEMEFINAMLTEDLDLEMYNPEWDAPPIAIMIVNPVNNSTNQVW